MNTADILTLLDPATPDTWPAGILATGDLREQRANLINEGGPGIWYVDGNTISGPGYPIAMVEDVYDGVLTEHIAAEANPAHALAAIHRWKNVVERHAPFQRMTPGKAPWCINCVPRTEKRLDWPCPDLQEVAAEARAYLGGTS